MWGKITGEVDRLLKVEVGDPRAEVAQIGPAGEPGLDADPVYGGPEYETLMFFGSMCGVGDLKLLPKASADANMYGIDTISCGSTIAWVMEAKAKGLLDDGLGLAFGDGRSVLRAIEAIALRRGVGRLLAEGSLRAAKTLGQAAVDLTVTVKGQELPAHMPRHKRSLGLIYAVNAFGADHQSSEHDSMLRTKPGSLHRRRLGELGEYGDLDLRDLSDAKVRFAYRTQCFYSALDTLGLCQFVWGPSWQLHGPSETVEFVRYATGWDTTLEEILEAGERRLHRCAPSTLARALARTPTCSRRSCSSPWAARARRPAWPSRPRNSSMRATATIDWPVATPTPAIRRAPKLPKLSLDWLAEAVSG